DRGEGLLVQDEAVECPDTSVTAIGADDVTVIIDPSGPRKAFKQARAGHVDRGEDALMQDEAPRLLQEEVLPCRIVAQDITAIIDPTGLRDLCVGHADPGDDVVVHHEVTADEITAIINPNGLPEACSGHIDCGEDALVQDEAIHQRAGKCIGAHDITPIVDSTGYREVCAGHIDCGEDALLQHEAVHSVASTLDIRTDDVTVIVDPEGGGRACAGHIDRGEV